MLSDFELLAYIESNPEKGLEYLINDYTGIVYSIVFSKLQNLYSREDIEECVSDIIYEFYIKREQVNLERGSIKSYICVMAKRRAIDVYRSKIKHTLSLPLEKADSIALNQNQADIVVEKERNSIIIQAIVDLGEPDSEIFLRKYYFGQSTKEIAKYVDIKENTIDKKVSRGLLKLKERLGGILYE